MNHRSHVCLLALLLTIGVLGTSCPTDVVTLTHTLTVDNGTGSGSYASGSIATISATVPAGFIFDTWTGDVAAVADVTAATTTVTVNADLAVSATFTTQTFTAFQDAEGQQLYFDNIQMVAGGVGYAVTSTGFPPALTFYKTTDNGATWATLGTVDSGNTGIGASYAIAFHPDVLAYTTYFSGFGFEGTAGTSLDGGASWSPIEDQVHEQYGGFNIPFGSAAVFADTFWLVVGEARDSLASLATANLASAAQEWTRTDLQVQAAVLLSTQGTVGGVGNLYLWANESASSDDWNVFVLTEAGWAGLRSVLAEDFWLTNWTMQRNMNSVTLIDHEDAQTAQRSAVFCDPDTGTYETIYSHGEGGDDDGYYLMRAIATGNSAYICLSSDSWAALGNTVLIRRAVGGGWETVVTEDEDQAYYYYFQTDYTGRVYALRRNQFTTGLYDLSRGE